MKTTYTRREARSVQLYSIIFLGLMMIVLGCQSKEEPPLSQAASSFKAEVKEAINMLSPALIDPVSNSNVKTINATLSKIFPESIKLCRACPFIIGILDKDGIALTVYPRKKVYSKDYSQYKLVQQAMRDGIICHDKLYLQDGSMLYTICVPLIKKGKTAGFLVLTTSSKEVEQRWGIKEQEFFSIDFNK